MALADKIAGWLVVALGAAHLIVGHAAFVAPSVSRVWFASAGFLLLVTGLANVAASRNHDRLTSVAALAGSLSILIVGGLLAAANATLLFQPQTILLLLIGLFLSLRRIRAMSLPRVM